MLERGTFAFPQGVDISVERLLRFREGTFQYERGTFAEGTFLLRLLRFHEGTFQS